MYKPVKIVNWQPIPRSVNAGYKFDCPIKWITKVMHILGWIKPLYKETIEYSTIDMENMETLEKIFEVVRGYERAYHTKCTLLIVGSRLYSELINTEYKYMLNVRRNENGTTFVYGIPIYVTPHIDGIIPLNINTLLYEGFIN